MRQGLASRTKGDADRPDFSDPAGPPSVMIRVRVLTKGTRVTRRPRSARAAAGINKWDEAISRIRARMRRIAPRAFNRPRSAPSFTRFFLAVRPAPCAKGGGRTSPSRWFNPTLQMVPRSAIPRATRNDRLIRAVIRLIRVTNSLVPAPARPIPPATQNDPSHPCGHPSHAVTDSLMPALRRQRALR